MGRLTDEVVMTLVIFGSAASLEGIASVILLPELDSHGLIELDRCVRGRAAGFVGSSLNRR